MNQLLNISEQKSSITMSSREIAELCEKEHRHVLRDIRAYVGAIIQMERGINVKSLDWSGKEGVELFGHTQKIIDRWQELETQVPQSSKTPHIPQTYAEALRLAADQAEQNQLLQLENKQKTEENNALKSYFEPGLTPAQFVKGLNGVNSNKINDYLRTRGWLYKEKHCWRVCSQVRDKYLTESFKRIEVDPVERIEMTTYKPILLEKGAVKIFEAYLQGKLPMKADWNGKYYHSKVAV
ncbi:Rha family transcriptional regulator [Mannheimia haemolytica]|nr:Rha family transcriptional regulator [Mannheimia haemolytica]